MEVAVTLVLLGNHIITYNSHTQSQTPRLPNSTTLLLPLQIKEILDHIMLLTVFGPMILESFDKF